MRYAVFILVIFLFSCTKEKSCVSCEKGYKEAEIIDAGIVAADGCDWVIRVDDTNYYHPDVLDDSFKQNGLEVKICYEITNDNFICGFNATGLKVIHVIDIRR